MEISISASVMQYIIRRADKDIDAFSPLPYLPGMTLNDMILERGFRQNWIASKLGLSQSYFSEIVRAKRPLPAAYDKPLAKILRVPIVDVQRAGRPDGSGGMTP